MLVRAITRVITGIVGLVVLAAWAVIGFVLWLPLLTRMILTFTGAVVASMYSSNANLVGAQHSLEFAITFYVNGFRKILTALETLDSRATLPKDSGFELKRMFGGVILAIVFWGGIFYAWKVVVGQTVVAWESSREWVGWTWIQPPGVVVASTPKKPESSAGTAASKYICGELVGYSECKRLAPELADPVVWCVARPKDWRCTLAEDWKGTLPVLPAGTTITRKNQRYFAENRNWKSPMILTPKEHWQICLDAKTVLDRLDWSCREADL